MAISKKVRFEVFKRDCFTCQYCGEKAPNVILEIDHIKPKAKGGKDDIVNYITSCFDCNRGKGARELNDDSVIEKQQKQLELLQERRNQIEMIFEWKKELENIDTYLVEKICDYWEKRTFCAATITEWGVRRVRELIKKHDLKMILDAIDISLEKYLKYEDINEPTHGSLSIAFDKIGPICTNMRMNAKNPWVRDLLYIRGIMRNRFPYLNENMALDLLKKMYKNGIDVDDMKTMAFECKTWSQWKEVVEESLT